MDPLAANPLHFKPCLGFYCLQLMLLFSNFFFFFEPATSGKMKFLSGNKSTWITLKTRTK